MQPIDQKPESNLEPSPWWSRALIAMFFTAMAAIALAYYISYQNGDQYKDMRRLEVTGVLTKAMLVDGSCVASSTKLTLSDSVTGEEETYEFYTEGIFGKELSIGSSYHITAFKTNDGPGSSFWNCDNITKEEPNA